MPLFYRLTPMRPRCQAATCYMSFARESTGNGSIDALDIAVVTDREEQQAHRAQASSSANPTSSYRQLTSLWKALVLPIESPGASSSALPVAVTETRAFHQGRNSGTETQQKHPHTSEVLWHFCKATEAHLLIGGHNGAPDRRSQDLASRVADHSKRSHHESSIVPQCLNV